MPYQSGGGRRNNVQLGVGQSIWAGNPPPAIPERVLDGIPGFLAWGALLLCLAMAVAFPRTLLLIATLVAAYSAVRFALAGIANVIGLRKIKRWERIDWCAYYQQHATNGSLAWADVHHIVIIPNYKEPLSVLRTTLDNLAQQRDACRALTIVLAMEAAEPGCTEKARLLRKEYADRFAHMHYTVHPRGLPGEMQCKSSNEAWAARWVKRKLVDELGYNLDHILVTTMDADTLWHPHHFFALTALFALNPERHLRFFQSPIRYHSNIWEINPLLRIVNANSTAFELAHLSAPWWRPLPISSYALSLRLLEASGYWDPDVIADESHMYIKAFFARETRVSIERVFLPFLAQATSGHNLLDAMRNRYQQTLRHAWGSKEVGYTIAKMLEHPEVDFRPAFRLLLRIAHDILLAGAGWVIITLGSQLPLLLNPGLLGELLERGFSDPIFAGLQISLAVVSILGIVFWYQDVSVRPPRPHPPTLGERLLTLISFPLLPILTLIFVAIPTLQAQTRLLLGTPLQFRVSKKT
ncbi:MAG: hypothetical protein GYB67_10290 [Chloroflexi bacterium]|nr:hypothetical protein [Chloroflexota bacterium]